LNTNTNIINQIKHELCNVSTAVARYIPELTLQHKGKELIACCPFHQENTPSFKIYDDDTRWKCFGCGKEGDLIDLVAESKSIDNSEAIKFLANDLHIEQDEPSVTVKRTKIRSHFYCNETGLKIVRKDVYLDGNGKKSVIQYRLENGKFIKGLGGLSRPLYKFPELLKSIAANQPIYFVEGEKDVETLLNIGLPATTTGSSQDQLRPDQIVFFPGGHEIIVLPDNDSPGEIYGDNIAGVLTSNGCKVKIIHLPGLKPKGDISDWLQVAGNTKEKLLQIVEQAPIRQPSNTDWECEFEVNQFGNKKSCSKNFLLIMNNDPIFKFIQFNELSQQIEFNKDKDEPYSLDDNGEAMLRIHIDCTYGMRSPAVCHDSLIWAAYQKKYHPVKNYFDKLPQWDGTIRAERIFIDYLGAEDCQYTKNVTKMILKAAYERVFKPGEKFDLILVIRGPQGIGKSVLISKLGVHWSHASLRLTDMKDTKIAAEKIQGYWIVEIPELAGMSTAELESTKAFITATDDVFREAFAKKVKKVKRSSIMIASTNAEHGYLRDETGGRRFIDLYCKGGTGLTAMKINDNFISQLWSEVKTTYSDVKLTLEGTDLERSRLDQQEQIEQDPREDLVAEYLDTPIPASWYKELVHVRHAFIDNPDNFPHLTESAKLREVVCIAEVYEECFGLNKGQMQNKDRAAITRILTRLGWKKYEGKKRCGAYGAARGFDRP